MHVDVTFKIENDVKGLCAFNRESLRGVGYYTYINLPVQYNSWRHSGQMEPA
jgi:hypothetical protein